MEDPNHSQDLSHGHNQSQPHNGNQPLEGQRLRSSRHLIRSLKAKANARRTPAERLADWVTAASGSVLFLVFNILWFVVWIILNLGWIPGIEPFDPFPFGLLTMIVSLEAIILAIFVLVSQNREAKINDIRDESTLQLDIISEHELTKIIEMLLIVLQKNGVDLSQDPEIKEMLKTTDMAKIERSLERQIKK